MKKLLAILLAAIMVFSLTACGGSSSGGAKGTGLWKVSYTDGTVEYYEIFSNGSKWLSCRNVTGTGSKNLLDNFGDDDFDYLAEMGFTNIAVTDVDFEDILDGSFFDYSAYYLSDEEKALLKPAFMAEALRLKEKGTNEQQLALVAFAKDINDSGYRYDMYTVPGELRRPSHFTRFTTLDFDEQCAWVTRFNAAIAFEGNSKKLTVTGDWNAPFLSGAVWERIGDTENNNSELSIKDLSDLNGIWRVESYDAEGNVNSAKHIKLYKSEDSENYLKYDEVAPNGSENILEVLEGDIKTYLAQNGYGADYADEKINWSSGNYTFEESIEFDMSDMLSGKPYDGWSSFEGVSTDGREFAAPYFKKAAEAVENEDLSVQYALCEFYNELSDTIKNYNGSGVVKGYTGGYNWSPEDHFFKVGSEDILTLSGNSKKLTVTDGFFMSFPAGTVLTRVK